MKLTGTVWMVPDAVGPSRAMRRALRACCTLVLCTLVLCIGIGMAANATAGPREQAKRIHDRIAGVPPSGAVVDEMADLIGQGEEIDAAYRAMDNPAFFTAALKNFITPWTNQEQTVFDELNDYTATVIGIIRDDLPFTEVLSSDLVYVGAAGVVSAGYSHTNNDHYRQLEQQRVDLGDPGLLVGVPQSSLSASELMPSETAGVITTRAAARSFFSAGTNRRMWRYLAINYLCRDMEDLNDIARPADRIRQDVSRSPGGDSAIFHNTCAGCHSGMDPLAQAFAFFEYDSEEERLVHSRGVVQEKYLINANTFQGGFITEDNRWDNFWRAGRNSSLGWRAAESGGYGAKSLGIEVASSRAFSQCQVEKVFENICFRTPTSAEDRAEVERIADVFEAENYSMKRVFAETAVSCMGD
jgi:hypothetical protein